MNEGFWKAFQTFFVWGIEAWVLPSPILLVGLLSLSIIIAVYSFRRRQVRTHWCPAYWLVFTQLLFYPLIIGVAAGFQGVLRGPDQNPHTNPTGDHLLDVLLYTSLATACFWIYRMKGVRWLAVGLVVFQETILYGALFIAGMAISGDWI
jgi:VanZ family protein